MDTEADRAKGCMCEGATTSKVFINFGCLIHFACQVLAIVVVSLFKDICHLLCGRQHQQKCHKKSPTRTQAMNEHQNTSERDRVRERESERGRCPECASQHRKDNSNVIYKSTRLICYLCRRFAPHLHQCISARLHLAGIRSRALKFVAAEGGSKCKYIAQSWVCFLFGFAIAPIIIC